MEDNKREMENNEEEVVVDRWTELMFGRRPHIEEAEDTGEGDNK